MINDIAIPIASATTIYLSLQDGERHLQRWGPVVGLLSQPLWFYETIDAGQVGLFVTTVLFTGVYINGFYNYWCKSAGVPE